MRGRAAPADRVCAAPVCNDRLPRVRFAYPGYVLCAGAAMCRDLTFDLPRRRHAAVASGGAWPSPAASTISATRPSPRMVAPDTPAMRL